MYVPQVERERIGRMVDADKQADRIRLQWMRDWLRPFRKSDRELYHTDLAFREAEKARWRDTYAGRKQDEVSRVAAYKRAHAERNLEWTAVRKDRESMLGDGSVTPDVIARMKAAATHCAYCGCVLSDKQTDHMIPLVLAGEHSLRNIVIVCPPCNGRKARLSYEEWIERVEPEHKQRVMAVYHERYGEARHHEQSCCQSETFGPPFAINSGALRDLTI